MKAAINENGVLTIEPKNGLEMYALNKWFENYNGKGDNSSLICVGFDKLPKETNKNKNRQAD